MTKQTKTGRLGEGETGRLVLRAFTFLYPCLLVALVSFCSRNAVADDVDAAVLAAQAKRVEIIAKISKPTIAIFDAGGQGGGSGVIITPDGYALTNFHVAAPSGPAMKVGLSDGRFVDAVLVGLDPGGDVALIKLFPQEGTDKASGTSKGGENTGTASAAPKDEFPIAEIGDSDKVRAGDWAFVAGNPFLLADDFKPTITYGIISGVHRYQYPAGTLLEYADCLQTDASINPGNSGGPLWDSDGRLIGINGRGSFEKRGRVNVGVGYAISINQIKRFIGLLRSGRIVDHASLGATVAKGPEGHVVVDEILEESDAFRRGLRFDDQIVRLGGREIRSPNDFKNVLGTYPGGWRVPVTYRRDGRDREVRVRLANFHRAGELQALLESEEGRPGPEQPPRRGDEPNPPDGRRGRRGGRGPGEPEQPPDGRRPTRRGRGSAPVIPVVVKSHYEKRSGFANYWFNRYHQQRVWNAFLARGDFAETGWNWNVQAKLASGENVTIELSEKAGAVTMPVGRSEADFTQSLSEAMSPPRSGGLLAALHLWQRLLLVSPSRFGEIVYVGEMPWLKQDEAVDCLAASSGGVDTEFYFNPATGDLLGLEMQASDEQDPCTIVFSDLRQVDGRFLPYRWVVKHGDEVFADLTVTTWERNANAADAKAVEKSKD